MKRPRSKPNGACACCSRLSESIQAFFSWFSCPCSLLSCISCGWPLWSLSACSSKARLKFWKKGLMGTSHFDCVSFLNACPWVSVSVPLFAWGDFSDNDRIRHWSMSTTEYRKESLQWSFKPLLWYYPTSLGFLISRIYSHQSNVRYEFPLLECVLSQIRHIDWLLTHVQCHYFPLKQLNWLQPSPITGSLFWWQEIARWYSVFSIIRRPH